jgi:CheY-like chemotaxis protein
MDKAQSLEQLLMQEGYLRIHYTCSLAEVLGLHHGHGYDLILMNLALSNPDVIAVIQNLQHGQAICDLPLICVMTERHLNPEFLRAGAKDVIADPFDNLEILTRIRNLLEARFQSKQLAIYEEALDGLVDIRTQNIQNKLLRYQALTELASDWYWEQNAYGEFVFTSGPVQEMIGLPLALNAGSCDLNNSKICHPEERLALMNLINSKTPFKDFVLSRAGRDGSLQKFSVSGQPILNHSGQAVGFRGIGREIKEKN